MQGRFGGPNMEHHCLCGVTCSLRHRHVTTHMAAPNQGSSPGLWWPRFYWGSTTCCPGLAATCSPSQPRDEALLSSRGQNGHRMAHTPLVACPVAKGPSGVGGGQTPGQVSVCVTAHACHHVTDQDTGARTSGDLPGLGCTRPADLLPQPLSAPCPAPSRARCASAGVVQPSRLPT